VTVAALTLRLLLPCLLLCWPVNGLLAAEARIAVASNFMAPAQVLAQQLAASGEHIVVLLSGSTGRHYAQIINGAPFDALLAADEERPALLEQEGRALAGSRFTYAIGRLVLWSRDPALVDAKGEVLASGDFRRLAIANPALAPYGRAALETLTSLGLLERLQARLVRGENIAQAYQFVVTGNAELGLLADAQMHGPQAPVGGSQWRVPGELHQPIRQQAVLLRDNAAARAYLELLASQATQELLAGFGYDSAHAEPASP
jgi:molybdate transport system substrate-binding protein